MKNKDGRTAARQEVWSAVPAKGRTLLKYFPELTSAAASGKGLAKFAFDVAGLSYCCTLVNSCFVHVPMHVQQAGHLHSSCYPVACVSGCLMYTEH